MIKQHFAVYYLSGQVFRVNLDIFFAARGLFDQFAQNAGCVAAFGQGKADCQLVLRNVRN